MRLCLALGLALLTGDGARADMLTSSLYGRMRIERYTATTDSAGQASYAWVACMSAPDLEVVPTFIASGPTMIGGNVTASTLSMAPVQAYETQAVVVGGQPYKAAAAGRAVTLRVMC